MENTMNGAVNNGKKKGSIRKIILAIGIPVGTIAVLFIALVIGSIVSTNKKIKAGDELFQKGEYALAIEQYDSAVGNGSVPNAEALKKRGLTFAAMGDFQNAVRDLTASLEGVSNDVETLRYRAESYENIGDYINAIADFEKILKLAPNSVSARGVEEHIKDLQNNRR